MSMRLKLITGLIVSLVVLLALCAAASFLLFWLLATPYVGRNLAENIGAIAARYFLIALLVVVVLGAVGALWTLSSTQKNFLRPLRMLRRAALEIRDGNLDFELVVTGADEFTELALCFEQMRVRLKNSTRQQQAVEEERRMLMDSICHDLKTPITSILGYAEGILDGVADTPEKTRQYAGVIRKKSISLQTLSDDLSLLSRLENAQLPLDLAVCDLAVLVGELAEEFRGEVPDVSLAVTVPSGLVCRIDREKIGRVLLNLLQNSVKYHKVGGPPPRIEIAARGVEDRVLLTVSDNGSGVPAQELTRVFDRFYRVDASRGVVKGSGLGLSIARQIVLAHGGKIWLANRPEGGLMVSISLAMAQVERRGEP